MDNFWKNAFGQIHYWWQAVGVTMFIAVLAYVTNNSDWTVRGAIAIAAGVLVAFLTKVDHKKTKEAVKEAEKKEGEQ